MPPPILQMGKSRDCVCSKPTGKKKKTPQPFTAHLCLNCRWGLRWLLYSRGRVSLPSDIFSLLNFSQPYILSTEVYFFKSRTLLLLYTTVAETQPQPSLQGGVISLLVIYIWELLICMHGFKNTTTDKLG